MTDTFTLAHLSDVHLAPLPGFPARHWNLKRTLGYLNWLRKRRAAHLRPTLDALVADVKAQAPDHIAVTGDLINIGLPAEYVAAEQWLRALGPPDRVTVVPGNHDIYTRLRNDPGHERWRAYMASDAAGIALLRGQATSGGFPFVRRFGRIALIGLNSAVPTRPLYANGRLGTEQRARLEDLLQRLGRDGALRVVLIHHPPFLGQASSKKALEDAAEHEAILRQFGAELVLHGHNHRSMHAVRHWPVAKWATEGQCNDRPVAKWATEGQSNDCPGTLGKQREIVTVGVPSASFGVRHPHENLARYHMFRISQSGGAVEMIARGMTEPGGPIVEIERRAIGGAAAKLDEKT